MTNDRFNCTICGSLEIREQFTVTREDKYAQHDSNAGREPARYRECKGCGAMIFNGSAEFERSYSDGSYYSVDGDPAAFLEKRFTTVVNLPPERSDNLQRVRRIREFVGEGNGRRRVLDIGAGMGVFLYAFLNSRWDGVAVEPDRYCCALMKQKMPHAEILNGYSSEVPHAARYDLITMNRVLEHIKNPLPVLREEHAHLKDDGILYIELPDVWSFFYDGPNNEAFGYGHFIVYSPAALELLAREAGFELMHLNRVMEPSTKFSLYAFFRKRGSGTRLVPGGS